MEERLIILGASGNIGEQALAVLDEKKDIALVGFSVGNNTKVINSIVKRHSEIKGICVKNNEDKIKLEKEYKKIKFYSGDDGLIQLLENVQSTMVLNALVGFVGLKPTLKTIELNIDLALANKESLVVGGELVNKALKHSKTILYPVDSEHSALYKCLKTVKRKDVKELLVTASGGAFRNLTREALKNVTPKEALHHPTWKMGPKVTIDSASMLNKGFELIEAYYLFNFPMRKIKVLMHDESYVHSIVRLKNNKYIAEVNAPNMMNPIRYALYRGNIPTDLKEVNNLKEFGSYHFRAFDEKRYPMVKYALRALKKKGVMPCVLNAVDEVLVSMFLKDEITFLDIELITKLALKTFRNYHHPDVDTLVRIDKEAREWAKAAGYLKGSK